jgi:hypothetical protein
MKVSCKESSASPRAVPELRHLRYFVAVAEELNFSRAARRLRMAQPPLSVAIRQLEQELGAELFLRSSREVTLTEAGRTLLDGARRTLAEAERAMAEARRASAGEVGSLRLAFSWSARFETLPGSRPGLQDGTARRGASDRGDVERAHASRPSQRLGRRRGGALPRDRRRALLREPSSHLYWENRRSPS